MSTVTNVNILYEKYKKEFSVFINRFEKDGEKAIPYVVSRIAYVMVPEIMVDVGHYKKLSGHEKKILVIDTVMYSIDTLFNELNVSSHLSKESWDERVRDLLKELLPETIETLISVEKGQLKFNGGFFRKLFSCFM